MGLDFQEAFPMYVGGGTVSAVLGKTLSYWRIDVMFAKSFLCDSVHFRVLDQTGIHTSCRNTNNTACSRANLQRQKISIPIRLPYQNLLFTTAGIASCYGDNQLGPHTKLANANLCESVLVKP